MSKRFLFRLGLWTLPVCIRSWLVNQRLWNIAFWTIPLGVGMIWMHLDSEGTGWTGRIFGSAVWGVLVSYFVLRFLFLLFSRINGGPFHVGDKVTILTGKYKGRSGVVYEEWKDRGQVRVEIGDSARNTCEDVFSHMELILEL